VISKQDLSETLLEFRSDETYGSAVLRYRIAYGDLIRARNAVNRKRAIALARAWQPNPQSYIELGVDGNETVIHYVFKDVH
jgi:hypothetical protein